VIEDIKFTSILTGR